MSHVSAEGVAERMINLHFFKYFLKIILLLLVLLVVVVVLLLPLLLLLLLLLLHPDITVPVDWV